MIIADHNHLILKVSLSVSTMQGVLKRDGDVKLYGNLIDQLVESSSACCNVTMTSKITIPDPVEERFFFYQCTEEQILPLSTIRATQERRYYVT